MVTLHLLAWVKQDFSFAKKGKRNWLRREWRVVSNYVSWLITLLCEDQLMKCALRVNRDDIDESVYAYPMEPESREAIRGLLPSHVQSLGKIVDIAEIFEVFDLRTTAEIAGRMEGMLKTSASEIIRLQSDYEDSLGLNPSVNGVAVEIEQLLTDIQKAKGGTDGNSKN